MTTDNHPAEYIYLSERLLRLISEQSSAHTRRRAWSADTVQFGVPGVVSGTLRRSTPEDAKSPYALVDRCTAAVSDHTRSLNTPGHSYLRDALTLRPTLLDVQQMGRNRQAVRKVAWISGVCHGRLVVLLGSSNNYVGWRNSWSTDTTMQSDWAPSSPAGLRELIEAAHRGDIGEGPAVPRLTHDPALEILDGDGEVDALEAVVAIESTHRSSGRLVFPERDYEFLAKLLTDPGEVRTRGDVLMYDEVIIAAPLWIRTPMPLPM